MGDTTVNTVILSAGLSARMAHPKALLSFGTKTFIENIISVFSTVSEKVVVVVTPKLYFILRDKGISDHAEFVFNNRLHYGRFYSVYLGIKSVGVSNVFIQNVDVPGVKAQTLELMKRYVKPDSYVVPVYKGKRGHPVLLGERITQEILSVRSGYERLNLRVFLNQFDGVEVEVDDEFVILNVNTPADLEILYQKIYDFEN